LVQLRRLPFTEIKIDRCFVHDILVSEDSRAIVEAIIALARALGLSTTAEGVGSSEALALLATLGCNQAQGHFISPPITAAEVHEWPAAATGKPEWKARAL